MAVLVYLFLLCLAVAGGFVALHLDPLTKEHVLDLADQRRRSYLANYFRFTPGQVGVNGRFKSSLKPDGKFYTVSEPLREWPRIAAGLLKGKKHEWIVVAFEREQRIVLVWANKGPNNSTVPLGLPMDSVVAMAKERGCSSILISHNHPNSHPRYYDCTTPSQTDLDSAKHWQSILFTVGLSLIEFVCERGRAYEYWRAYCGSFAPLTAFVNRIQRLNGQSRWENLKLHWQRVFHTSAERLCPDVPDGEVA